MKKVAAMAGMSLTLILLLSLLFSIFRTGRTEKLVIDTDAGADDAIAILLALSAWNANDSDFDVVGITCVYGNTLEENVERNVLKTLTVANVSNIPVYGGSKKPIIGDFENGTYFGYDGLGDFEFTAEITSEVNESMHAVMALIELSKRYPGELSILALGSTTNIALATTLYPDFSKNIKKFYIMGGSVAGRGNKSPGVEFNFAADPMSNFIILNSTKMQPSLLFPWETVQDCAIPMKWRMEKLGPIQSDIVKFLNKAESKILTSAEWQPADAMAVAAMIWPNLIKRSLVTSITAVYDGAGKGTLLVDYADKTGHTKNIEIVQEFNVEEFKRLLIFYLS